MKLAFVAAETPAAELAKARLESKYGNLAPKEADCIVALGGDGFILETLHDFLHIETPIYGMNQGTLGFMMNEYLEDDLPNRIETSQSVKIHPLCMTAKRVNGEIVTALGFNEVYLLRQTRQASKLRILIDGVERIEELVCDGIITATPAGSTAYNLSAHGPIIPLNANLLALTPISPFRPRRWRGALLPHTAQIRIEVMDGEKRPVSAVADYTEVREVQSVEVQEDKSVFQTILFDPAQSLEERVLREQFSP
jgi:NAD+ kinase